ncbi:BNR repeat-containing protein [Myxococcota bacterium]|nr:BNR repeat-containing protein [Myxococcota bacterium]
MASLPLSLVLGLLACSGLFKGGGDEPDDNDPRPTDGGAPDGGAPDGGADDTGTPGTDGGGGDGGADGGGWDGGADGGGGDGGADGGADGGGDGGGDPLLSDDDGDGWSEDEGDCDDADDAIGPGEAEIPYDGVDNDCDEATVDDDLDGDGVGSDEAGGEDCDDGDAEVGPDAEEDTTNEVDDDCDGDVDEPFEVETAVSGCDCGDPSSIAVDSEGQVHLVWFDADRGSVDHALHDGASWSTAETVVRYSWGVAGEYLDSVVDGADRLQIAYTLWDEARTGYTEVDFQFRDSDGEWSEAFIVDDHALSGSEQLGFYVSIDVDDENLPSFAYYDYDAREPRLADVLTSPWSLLGIDALYTNLDENYLYQLGLEDCDIGLWTSLQVDESGFDNVAYYDGCALAQEAQFTRLDWDLDALAYSETIAADGGYPSLALSTAGDRCAAWYDGATADLEFGCSTDGGLSWTEETVDDDGAVGQYAALAFDDKADPWIAYYDATHGDLKVAHRDGGAWEVWTVDEDGDVGRAPSIAVGPDGRVHLSWYDATKGELRYGRAN